VEIYFTSNQETNVGKATVYDKGGKGYIIYSTTVHIFLLRQLIVSQLLHSLTGTGTSTGCWWFNF
jgi:hypothetical protein